MPVQAGLEADATGRCVRGPVSVTCSNDMTSLSARKRCRHGRPTILINAGEAIVLQRRKRAALPKGLKHKWAEADAFPPTTAARCSADGDRRNFARRDAAD